MEVLSVRHTVVLCPNGRTYRTFSMRVVKYVIYDVSQNNFEGSLCTDISFALTATKVCIVTELAKRKLLGIHQARL